METRMEHAKRIAQEVRVSQRQWRIADEAKIARKKSPIENRKRRGIAWALYSPWLAIRRRGQALG